jgi:NAD(P)-dependent dehydrogenase (short-subunit alcohol dehydrogenase family)
VIEGEMAGLLDGDTALVTGAASGIGRGIARALAREGARLVLTDVLDEPGRGIAEETGSRFVVADLSQPTAYQDVFQAALGLLGGISVFVHCAAPPRREEQTALEVSAGQWDEMLSVTLRSGFLLGQAVGRHMRDTATRGRMLYLTSLHAETPRNLPHYSAAKAGQTMVVKELARALGPHGIRVNALAPGAIPGGGFKADVATLEPKIALGRTGTPEDIAGMAVALLCERFSAYVTGTTVVVDGGLALNNWIEPA